MCSSMGGNVDTPKDVAQAFSPAARVAALKGCATAALLCCATSAFAQTRLTLKDAEKIAVDRNPQVRAGQYAALAATESIREAKAAYFPNAFGSFTGAGALDGTRIAAG